MVEYSSEGTVMLHIAYGIKQDDVRTTTTTTTTNDIYIND
jgi:hypothetical protein